MSGTTPGAYKGAQTRRVSAELSRKSAGPKPSASIPERVAARTPKTLQGKR